MKIFVHREGVAHSPHAVSAKEYPEGSSSRAKRTRLFQWPGLFTGKKLEPNREREEETMDLIFGLGTVPESIIQ